jgi:hypothetical protein
VLYSPVFAVNPGELIVPGLCCSYAVIPDDALRHRFKKAAR